MFVDTWIAESRSLEQSYRIKAGTRFVRVVDFADSSLMVSGLWNWKIIDKVEVPAYGVAGKSFILRGLLTFIAGI